MRAVTLAFVLAAGCAAPRYQAIPRSTVSVGAGVAHAEGRFEGAGGLSMFRQSWRPEREPEGVVILVHGLKDHGTRYSAFAGELVARGLAVHALDLRGHGWSEGDRVWVDAFDQYLDDLGRFIEVVKAEEGAKPLFLFGHSMGGAIVTLYTIERKPDLRGLVLSAPALKVGADVNAFLAAITGALGTVTPTLAIFSLDDEMFSRDPEAVKAMKADPAIYQGNAPARTARELLRALGRIEARMAELGVPFIAAHGTGDAITNPDGSRQLQIKAKATDKTLKLMPGAYHDLLHDPGREGTAIELADWVAIRARRAP